MSDSLITPLFFHLLFFIVTFHYIILLKRALSSMFFHLFLFTPVIHPLTILNKLLLFNYFAFFTTVIMNVIINWPTGWHSHFLFLSLSQTFRTFAEQLRLTRFCRHTWCMDHECMLGGAILLSLKQVLCDGVVLCVVAAKIQRQRRWERSCCCVSVIRLQYSECFYTPLRLV